MIAAFIVKVRGFLMEPAHAFQWVKDEEPGAVLLYFAPLLLLNAILSALFFSVTMGTMPVPGMKAEGIPGAVTVFFIILVGGFIITLLFGAWLHLFVYMFGGRRGIGQTIRAVLYGDTPYLLLGWIPFIGFFSALWSLVLAILGIRELQEISSMKATLAVALAVMIPLILLILLAAFFMIASVTTTAAPAPVAQVQ